MLPASARAAMLPAWHRQSLHPCLVPWQILLAMAAGMSIAVAAWMLARGMRRRNAAEIAAAIVPPVLPFAGLAWSGVTSSAVCWGYRAAAVAAVLVLLRLRRGSYPAGR